MSWAAASSSRPILANVNTQMAVAREETFGPVAPLFRFKHRRRGGADGQ